MQRTHVVVNSQKVSCLINNLHHSPTYLFLTPGTTNCEFFNDINKIIGDKSIIIPDYPARGQSDTQSNYSTQGIAETLSEVIEKLNISNIILIAYSYGTNIGFEMIKLAPNRFKSIHLVAPGEYFNDTLRLVLKFIFWIPIFIKPLLPKYRQYLINNRILPVNYQSQNLDHICKQVVEIMNFRFQSNNTIGIPCNIYNFADDRLVVQSSIGKLHNIFSNLSTVKLIGKHPTSRKDYTQFETVYLPHIT